MVTINEAREMANLPKVGKLGDFTGEDMYVGFTQAIIKDDDEITDMNGQAPNQEADKDKKDKPKKDDKK